MMLADTMNLDRRPGLSAEGKKLSCRECGPLCQAKGIRRRGRAGIQEETNGQEATAVL